MFLSGDVNLLFSSLHRKGGSAAPLAPPHIRRWHSECISIIAIPFQDKMRNGYRTQSNLNRTQSNLNQTNRTQSNLNRTNRTQSNLNQTNRTQSNLNRISIESENRGNIQLRFDCVRQSNFNRSIAFNCVRLVRSRAEPVRLTSSGDNR